MKVLFYCQHLMGIGHVTRSLSIVNELAESFSITFIEGGPAISKSPELGIRVERIAPLLMREGTNELYDPEGKRSVGEIFLDRGERLSELAEEFYDAIVIEFYPFGRKKFASEIRKFISHAKKINPKIKIICSVRDLLVQKNDWLTRDIKIAEEIRQNYDRVWVHSDPALIRLAQTFSQEEAISDRIVYTGFVTEKNKVTKKRINKILVSLGGGGLGPELCPAVARVVKDLNYQFHFAFGPYSNPAIRQEVESLTDPYKGRVILSGLLPNFEEELSSSALSISLGGYNTVMNLLHTRTPALVYPYGGNHEQTTRAKLLEDRGYLKILQTSDLTPDRLLACIRGQLIAPYPEALPNLQGASECRRDLERLLGV